MADNGVIIRCFHAVKACHHGTLILGVLAELQGEFYVFGSQRCTVVEGHIVSQMEGVIQSVVADLVGFCDSRLRIMASVGVHVHQSVVDLA